ncbi:hypothetical protein HY612_05435 [Candidatus Roizmanbacteria bacterium]|nr:hypothetical protein [Candidatus Roizmanbacteria bacterium]
MLNSYNVCNRVNSGEVDELWLFGGPWFGFYESRLAGPNGFEYNSPPLGGTSCSKLIPIMGFSYEYGVENMVHDFGHRAEATMTKVYGSWEENRLEHSWDKFGLVKTQSPNFNFSGCGSTHYAPNSPDGYIYDSSINVDSFCDNFFNYPNLSPAENVLKTINCNAWSCSEIGYYEYWFGHLPKFTGVGPDDKLNDWWEYILDPNVVK